MASDDIWSRKRREEEREEQQREEAKSKQAGVRSLVAVANPAQGVPSDAFPDTFEEMLKQVPVLIEQLNHLYNQFVAGILATPPREVRGRLDHMMIRIAHEQKVTPSSRFRSQSANESYVSHCARWDRMLHDLESGKIKRFAGPMTNRAHGNRMKAQ